MIRTELDEFDTNYIFSFHIGNNFTYKGARVGLDHRFQTALFF